MNQHYFNSFAAATYSCGAYGASTYSNNTCGITTPSTSGGLVNTGTDVYVPLVGGILLIILAVILFVTGIRKKRRINTT